MESRHAPQASSILKLFALSGFFAVIVLSMALGSSSLAETPIATGDSSVDASGESSGEFDMSPHSDSGRIPTNPKTVEAKSADPKKVQQDLIQSLNRLESAVQDFKNHQASSPAQIKSLPIEWQDLAQFQDALWRAMALDPGPGSVPPAMVPKHLFANEINEELLIQFEKIKKSSLPKELGIEREFEDYTSTVAQVISYRRFRQFPQARNIAKRGILETSYRNLVQKLSASAGQRWAVQGGLDAARLKTIDDMVASARATFVQAETRAKVFNNGRNFLGYGLVMMAGLLIGVMVMRARQTAGGWVAKAFDKVMGPLPGPKVAPTITERFQYLDWLKQFEFILARVKQNQISQEQRVTEMVSTAERTVQAALALYSDARIRGEANLEQRMSALLRDLQYQFESGQKLKTSDRVPFPVMLEHCLKLCDAIEAGKISLKDKSQPLVEPPARMSA